MSHHDGVRTERFAIAQLNTANITAKIVHKPFDIAIHNISEAPITHIEIKSARLSTASKTYNQVGRYEFHSLKQLERMKKADIWVMLIIQSKHSMTIQGMIKAVHLPNKIKFSILEIEKHKKLFSFQKGIMHIQKRKYL